MTYHLLDMVARAGVWRAFHGVTPLVAVLIVAICFVGLYLVRK